MPSGSCRSRWVLFPDTGIGDSPKHLTFPDNKNRIVPDLQANAFTVKEPFPFAKRAFIVRM